MQHHDDNNKPTFSKKGVLLGLVAYVVLVILVAGILL